MVYESGFTTRRTYASRPVVTSYAVSYPTVTKVSRVYKTSYPIYSTSSYTRGTRVISSPVRIVTSPARVITRVISSPSPVRITRTTTRVVTSPERISSYTYTTPTTYTPSYIPSTYYSSYIPYVSSYIPRYISSYTPSTYLYTTPSYLYSSPVTRIYSRSLTPIRGTTSPLRITPSYLKRTLPGYGARALTNYINTEPFTTFREETDRIRHRTQSLMRDLHTPVIRRTRSMTPFPVTGYEPTTDVAFDAYVSRITNPVRHIAKEVHRMSMYPQPAHKYVDPELDPHRPSRKFSAPRPLEDPIDDETKEKQRLRKERLMAVNEEELDTVELEKKKAQLADEAKRREQIALEEEVKSKAEKEAQRKANEEAAQQEVEKARLAEEERKQREEEEEEEIKRLAEIEKEAQEALKAAKAAEKKALEEEQKRKAFEEEQKRLEEEAKLAEEARLAEEATLAEEAARKAEEQRIREEEIKRLAEIEKQAEEEHEAELARQAAELAEIARQDAEIAAQELHNIEQTEQAETATNTAEELIIEEHGTPEIHQVQEPIIDLNIDSGDADVVDATTEEETEEE